MKVILDIYKNYLACLNSRSWDELKNFVEESVCYNGQQIGLPGYQSMLEQNYREIPDLYFRPGLLLAGECLVACRLEFDCTPAGEFLGLPVNGRQVRFTENVFYQFENNKIKQVWSVIDKRAIEQQL